MGTIVLLFFLGLPGMMMAVPSYRAAQWCWHRRRLRLLVFLALAVLGAGTAYGLLRLTGMVLLPGDNTYSVNTFDASWRDEGVRWVLAYGWPFAAVLAALARERKHEEKSSLRGKHKEEKS